MSDVNIIMMIITRARHLLFVLHHLLLWHPPVMRDVRHLRCMWHVISGVWQPARDAGASSWLLIVLVATAATWHILHIAHDVLSGGVISILSVVRTHGGKSMWRTAKFPPCINQIWGDALPGCLVHLKWVNCTDQDPAENASDLYFFYKKVMQNSEGLAESKNKQKIQINMNDCQRYHCLMWFCLQQS